MSRPTEPGNPSGGLSFWLLLVMCLLFVVLAFVALGIWLYMN